MIKCEICKKDFQQITFSHLKKAHNISVYDYKILYPNEPEKYKEIGWNCIVYWEHQVKSKDFTIDMILQDLNEWEFEDFTYNDFNGGWML